MIAEGMERMKGVAGRTVGRAVIAPPTLRVDRITHARPVELFIVLGQWTASLQRVKMRLPTTLKSIDLFMPHRHGTQAPRLSRLERPCRSIYSQDQTSPEHEPCPANLSAAKPPSGR